MLRLRVKELAEAQGLNRSRLQIKSGVTLPLLNRYWDSVTTEVKLEALEKIANALGVKAGELITDEPEKLEEETSPLRRDKFTSQAEDITWS